ncbi:MAG: ABC transporter substrate-binding protein [Caulobacter sp. 12-67-6]|nr:MAG: ABC transporter substrate-binding protein [Caulobacter sp. 12-67-6]OYX71194.1 MAG: ABC transporter substrate-binding protein [Caulobacter sp. 32-67-35]OYX98021.1 MAG: ABC transporter substrate-binding protein [Caulobacter sp. 35-67-4]HQR89211.1 MlaD family protein [Caulobacter sp.]
MERNANYALVGAVTLLLFMGLVVFVVWLAKLSFNQEYDQYDILFVGPVRGLSEGGEVHFNGIKVGEVSKIALDKSDPNRVIARARVTSDVPIKTDSYATLEPQGITGVNYVQITAGTPDKKLLKDTVENGRVPVIRSQRSALSDLLEGGGTVLTRTIEALDRVNRVLSDDNIQSFSASLSDVQSVTAELRERKAIIADAQKALQSIDATAAEIAALSASTRGVVEGDGRRSIKELADAAGEIKAAAKDARGMISRLEGPTTDFATTGLPQLSQAIVTLQSAAESLDRLVGQVEQNPRGLVSKAPAKELEVKP